MIAVTGPILGFAVARATERVSSRVVAASQPSATANTAAAAALAQAEAAITSAGTIDVGAIGKTGSLTPPTRIILRTTADGIRIRAYTVDFKIPAPSGLAAACLPRQSLMGEVSDDLAVGQMPGFVFGDLPTPHPVAALSTDVVGVLEQSPMWSVMLRTAPNVTRVVAHFRDGTSDEMAPQQGWAIVAHHASPSVLSQLKTPGAVPNFGTVEAFDSAGQSLGIVPLTGVGMKTPVECLPGPLADTEKRRQAAIDGSPPPPSTKPLGDEMKPVTTIK